MKAAGRGLTVGELVEEIETGFGSGDYLSYNLPARVVVTLSDDLSIPAMVVEALGEELIIDISDDYDGEAQSLIHLRDALWEMTGETTKRTEKPTARARWALELLKDAGFDVE